MSWQSWERLISFRLALRVLTPNFNLPIPMAAKKTAKTTPESASPASDAAAKPVAKKATKTAKKVAAKDAGPTPAAANHSTPPAKKPAAKPSLDAIARAAYLNYRRRVEQGLPGDSHGDWLEAERQASEAS